MKAKWRSKCKALQLKVAELKPQDMQSGEANYQAARSIRDSLIATAEKNFLGYYKGEAGIWDKLVRAYEAESVFPFPLDLPSSKIQPPHLPTSTCSSCDQSIGLWSEDASHIYTKSYNVECMHCTLQEAESLLESYSRGCLPSAA